MKVVIDVLHQKIKVNLQNCCRTLVKVIVIFY